MEDFPSIENAKTILVPRIVYAGKWRGGIGQRGDFDDVAWVEADYPSPDAVGMETASQLPTFHSSAHPSHTYDSYNKHAVSFDSSFILAFTILL